MGVALRCTFYNDFLVKGTAPGGRPIEAKPILSYACLLKKQFHVCHCSGIFYRLRVLSCLETLVGNVCF